MVLFGQVVIGPPGAGKTTYCYGMEQFMQTLGRRVAVVNMDFANDRVPYKAVIDVRELVDLDQVMKETHLGPNGGLLYCMETLLTNMDWLIERINTLSSEVNYFVFDFPGQVELYSHHTVVQDILRRLQGIEFRLCSVHLVDSFYCSQPATFISAVLLTASTMMRLAMPHVNILSKVDLLSNYGRLPFNLDFYTELDDLNRMAAYVGTTVPEDEELLDVLHYDESEESKKIIPKEESKVTKKYKKMTTALCDVLSDFGLISYLPVNIEDASTVGRALNIIDKANGFAFAASVANNEDNVRDWNGSIDGSSSSSSSSSSSGQTMDKGIFNNIQLFKMASQECEPTFFRTMDIQEKYYDNSMDDPGQPVAGAVLGTDVNNKEIRNHGTNDK